MGSPPEGPASTTARTAPGDEIQHSRQPSSGDSNRVDRIRTAPIFNKDLQGISTAEHSKKWVVRHGTAKAAADEQPRGRLQHLIPVN